MFIQFITSFITFFIEIITRKNRVHKNKHYKSLIIFTRKHWLSTRLIFSLIFKLNFTNIPRRYNTKIKIYLRFI